MPRQLQRILVVCGKARMRSPTAAEILNFRPEVETDFAGPSADANERLSAGQIDRTEVIAVMDQAQIGRLKRQFGGALRSRGLAQQAFGLSGCARPVRLHAAGTCSPFDGSDQIRPGADGSPSQLTAKAGAIRSFNLTASCASDRLTGRPAAGPGPLEIIPPQPAGHIHDFTDEVKPRHGLCRHGLAVQGPRIDAAQCHLGGSVAF